MALTIRQIKLASGTPLPVLLGRDGVPLVGPLIYILTMVKAAGHSHNTQKNTLKAIRKLQDWSQIEFGQRIETAMQRHANFDHVRVFRLREYLEIPEKERHSKVSRLVQVRSSERLRSGPKPVRVRNAGQTTKQYLMVASDYIEWLSHEYAHPQANSLKKLIRSQISRLDDDHSPPRLGLADANRSRFLAVIHPDHPENPFSNYAMRLRNFVALRLGHVDKWRSQRRIEVMSMNPRKLSAVLS